LSKILLLFELLLYQILNPKSFQSKKNCAFL
jgi:hypothetical protein